MSEDAVLPPARAGALELRATYRLRVGDEMADELVAAVASMASRARLDAAGLREDLAERGMAEACPQRLADDLFRAVQELSKMVVVRFEQILLLGQQRRPPMNDQTTELSLG